MAKILKVVYSHALYPIGLSSICATTTTYPLNNRTRSFASSIQLTPPLIMMLQDTKTFPKCYVGRNGKRNQQKLHIPVCGSLQTQLNQFQRTHFVMAPLILVCLERSTHLYVYFLLISLAIPTNTRYKTFPKCYVGWNGKQNQ